MVLSTATAGNLRDVDFLPLTVDVEERMYAAGKIPGSFFKREGRAGEKGTLTARMIDRPIRPLFPKGWRRETQLVAIPMSVDHVNPYDILAMNGASAALMISDIPFPMPVGAVRIGQDEDGEFVVNPEEESLLEGDARPDRRGHRGGHPDGRGRRQRGHRGRDPRRARHRPRRDQEALRGAARAAEEGRQGEGRGRGPAGRREAARRGQGQVRRRAERGDPGRGQARAPGRDQEGRGGGLRGLRLRGRRRRGGRAPPGASSSRSTSSRRTRSASGSRSTRSAPTAARPTRSATSRSRSGIAPRTHGSALFTRGQTQALSVAALGTTREEMRLDTLGLETQQVLLPPLQLPAVLGRGGRLHARPEAPRHRPRRARRARARAGGPVDRGLPVHDPRRLGHLRVERLVVDGVGVRLEPLADGRGRADQARRSRASRWA